MKPKNDDTAGQLKQIGLKVDETGEFLESVAFALANQYKLIADRMPGLDEEERDVLRLTAQKALNGVEKHKVARKLFRDSIETFSKN